MRVRHLDREAAASRARRRRKYDAERPTSACSCCGDLFLHLFRKGPKSTVCSVRCYQRARYRLMVEATGRAVRACKRKFL